MDSTIKKYRPGPPEDPLVSYLLDRKGVLNENWIRR
jgi:hypothetical protein